MILTIRTDKPDAEIGLFEGQTKKAYQTWEAHRLLAETLHTRIRSLLQDNGAEWQYIQSVVCYEGPGSFTGLRIGISVANAIGYALGVPVVGATGDDWVADGVAALDARTSGSFVLPTYGSEAHITAPRK